MKYYSLEDIAGMRRAGCDRDSIDQATSKNLEADNLIALITSAFTGVELDDGVGLDEAQAIDDYKTLDERAVQRTKDEKLRWDQISAAELNRCNSSLSFFDAKGMRFHLPAYMIADIKDEYMFELNFTLTGSSEYSRSKFSLFSKAQRDAVRCFLNHAFNSIDYRGEEEIADALLGFWSEEED